MFLRQNNTKPQEQLYKQAVRAIRSATVVQLGQDVIYFYRVYTLRMSA